MAGERASDWMVIGRIVGAFGVKGEMKVEPYTDQPRRFLNIECVYLGANHRKTAISRARLHQGRVLMHIDGVETPEQVRRFQGEEVFIPRSEALPLPEGHYYLEDMIGIAVFDDRGSYLGDVIDVLRTGSNDVFVVGQGPTQILIPSLQDAFEEFDLAGRRMVVAPWVLRSDAARE
jgi:16S rRNA processing protein RimM